MMTEFSFLGELDNKDLFNLYFLATILLWHNLYTFFNKTHVDTTTLTHINHGFRSKTA